MTTGSPKWLSELKRGQKAIIRGFVNLESSFRLMEMGILPGMELKLIYASAFYDPLYINYNQGRSHLILTKKQAREILIKITP